MSSRRATGAAVWRARFFQEAGADLKCVIDRPFSDAEIQTLISWFDHIADVVREAGLRSDDGQEQADD